jgi:4a-hydroxytetrahydrobiopterin dehydratase
MAEVTGARITASQFHAADGVEDWRVVAGASARFAASYPDAVSLVAAIAALPAEEPPRIDLRADGVLVRLSTPNSDGLLASDIELARQVSAAAVSVGAVPQAETTQIIQLTIDASVSAHVMPFWRAVLGYDAQGSEDLVDPRGSGPNLWFQDMDEPRRHRNRIHVDLFVPHDIAEARVAAGVAAGGTIVFDRYAPAWWTLADCEGNEVDIATWQGRS